MGIEVKMTLRSEDPEALLRNDALRAFITLHRLGVEILVEPAPEGTPEASAVQFLTGALEGIAKTLPRPTRIVSSELPDPPPVTPEVLRDFVEEGAAWRRELEPRARAMQTSLVHWMTTGHKTACGQYDLHDLEAHFDYVSIDAERVTCPGCRAYAY